MFIKQVKQVEQITDVVCDICGRSCITDDPDCAIPEYGTLEADWGYFSNHDGIKITCHLCEDCFFKLIDHIENTLGGKVTRIDRNN
jgi:hypothetical protein